MNDSVRPVFVSTYPPEACGLATFTKDLADAVNDGPGNVVSLQHEFGLYSGEWGCDVLDFVEQCTKPIVTTLHMLLPDPAPLPLQLIRQIASRSRSVVVMTQIAARLLVEVYGVNSKRVKVIPHGVPQVPFSRDGSSKARLGLAGRRVICTFGLINRGKGLEHMVRGLRDVVVTCPDALYLIVGTTHPQVRRQEGGSYREKLQSQAEALGLREHVRFVNRYLGLPDLLSLLQACDVFVTPYPGKDQIASGTIAHAMAIGGAVVSTPYLYAQEVLAGGRGIIVPFSDRSALPEAAVRLLSDDRLRAKTRWRAHQDVRQMFWPTVGRRYLELFGQVAVVNPARRVSRVGEIVERVAAVPAGE
ncbi:MAG: glycosyltransferase [Pirellulales bacterium]